MAIYQQGDIVAVLFPFTTLSQSKKRPALIISNNMVNKTGDYLLVQITSQVKNDGLSLPIASTDFNGIPLPLISFLRIHKIFLLNESLISHRITKVKSAFSTRLHQDFIKLIK